MDKEFGIFEVSFQYNRRFVNATLYLEAFTESPNDFRMWVNEESFEKSINMHKSLIKKHSDKKGIVATEMCDKIANWIHRNVKHRNETGKTGMIDLSALCVLTEELLPQHYSNYLKPFIHAIYALFGDEYIQISHLPLLYNTYVTGPTPPHQDVREIINEAYNYWQSTEIGNKIYATLFHEATMEINEKKQQVLNAYSCMNLDNMAKLKEAKEKAEKALDVEMSNKRTRESSEIDRKIDEERKTKHAAFDLEMDEEKKRRREIIDKMQHDPSIRTEAVAINMIKESPAPAPAPAPHAFVFTMPAANQSVPSYLNIIKE